MASTQIRGNTQIINGTIADAQITARAAIQLTKLSKVPITPDGATVFTAPQSMGSQKLTNLADPTIASDAATKNYVDTHAGGTVTTVSVVGANGFSGTVANPGTTPAITLQTSVIGLLKGNGTAISAAVVGTDYVAASNFVVRETPSGTVNGVNTTFTLTNTPALNTETLFLNGLLQEPGAGNDYTISGATITMFSAPVTGDRLRVNYQK